MIHRDDMKMLFMCVGGSILTFNIYRAAKSFYDESRRANEWVPVGTVKKLSVFPVKSCRRKEVFSLYCDKLCVSIGELVDREFALIDAETGKIYTARLTPKLVLVEVDVVDRVLSFKLPSDQEMFVHLDTVIARYDVKRATIWDNLKVDGLDCGEEISKFFTEFTGTPVRLVMFRPELYNGRPCVTHPDWYNNPVPKRSDPVTYEDLSPYHITTEPSLVELNKRMDEKITSEQFRANIIVDKCLPWDEDRWSEMKIGDAEFACYKPCTRCILITVDPDTGVKHPGLQPLKKLREFRLAPEGKMRKEHKDDPMFGLNAGLIKPGYIHVGETVYARYKPSRF